MPSTPVIWARDNYNGTVKITVSGDGGVTNRLYYKKKTDSDWTTGNTRAGDGTITQTGLDVGIHYQFFCYANDGALSLPSNIAELFLGDIYTREPGQASMKAFINSFTKGQKWPTLFRKIEESRDVAGEDTYNPPAYVNRQYDLPDAGTIYYSEHPDEEAHDSAPSTNMWRCLGQIPVVFRGGQVLVDKGDMQTIAGNYHGTCSIEYDIRLGDILAIERKQRVGARTVEGVQYKVIRIERKTVFQSLDAKFLGFSRFVPWS